MAWAERQYSRARIDAAGDALITLQPDDPARSEEIDIINNWRSCHSYPLQIIKMTLRTRAKRQDGKALIAQRIKRLPSIALKLKHNPGMRLSRMQDIGGCRAVLSTVAGVYKLVKMYDSIKSRRRRGRPFMERSRDYIAEPKPDGYRSIHLILKYDTESKANKAFRGQQIEIQIRTKLQHAWATAVETAQTFTGQALKSKIKEASEDWLRFFALMGSAIAAREKRPLVPATPADNKERINELRAIQGRARIVECLTGWNAAIHHQEAKENAGAYAFLLVLDTANRMLRITSFTKDQLPKADQAYAEQEKASETDLHKQIVLVSVESLAALRKAYPNYYADTSVFIDAIKQELG